MRKAHGGDVLDDKTKCQICHKKFNDLRRHMREVHSENREEGICQITDLFGCFSIQFCYLRYCGNWRDKSNGKLLACGVAYLYTALRHTTKHNDTLPNSLLYVLISTTRPTLCISIENSAMIQ